MRRVTLTLVTEILFVLASFWAEHRLVGRRKQPYDAVAFPERGTLVNIQWCGYSKITNGTPLRPYP